VLGINLVMPVTLDDLGGALGGLLGAFGKAVESHHRGILSIGQIVRLSNSSDYNKGLSAE
jgi:hypothetical protein